MKIRIITLYLSIIAFNSFSQNVQIALSNKCLDTTSNLGLTKGKVPYLIIEIKNATGKDIYFKNPFLSLAKELPEFISSMAHSTYIEDKEIIKKHLISSKKGKLFFVKIGSSTSFYDVLEVQNEDVYKNKDTIYEISYVNDELSFIYSSIRLQKILDRKNFNQQLSLFSYSDKEYISLSEVKNKLSFNEFYEPNKDLILKNENHLDINSNKDVFCFLKKGESTSMKVNLIGFKLVGGTYHFSIDFDKFENFFEYKNKKINLPLNYKNYYLYQGNIKFNSLKVSF